ncbi:unnamed protein product [Symbiodinium sp. CCMP2456]|nr:unnamed protein product [Symbiodinium sp. CCMP2456]
MVIIQDCSSEKPQIISRNGPDNARVDVEALKAQARALRSKADSLRSDRITTTVPGNLRWGRVAVAAAVHGVLLIGFSTCIQAAASNRHLQDAMPWLVRLTIVFMFSLACCTLVYLGQGKQALAVVGVTFSLESILLHCLASFSTSHAGRVPLAYYEVLIGGTVTAVLSQVGLAAQSSQASAKRSSSSHFPAEKRRHTS